MSFTLLNAIAGIVGALNESSRQIVGTTPLVSSALVNLGARLLEISNEIVLAELKVLVEGTSRSAKTINVARESMGLPHIDFSVKRYEDKASQDRLEYMNLIRAVRYAFLKKQLDEYDVEHKRIVGDTHYTTKVLLKRGTWSTDFRYMYQISRDVYQIHGAKKTFDLFVANGRFDKGLSGNDVIHFPYHDDNPFHITVNPSNFIIPSPTQSELTACLQRLCKTLEAPEWPVVDLHALLMRTMKEKLTKEKISYYTQHLDNEDLDILTYRYNIYNVKISYSVDDPFIDPEVSRSHIAADMFLELGNFRHILSSIAYTDDEDIAIMAVENHLEQKPSPGDGGLYLAADLTKKNIGADFDKVKAFKELLNNDLDVDTSLSGPQLKQLHPMLNAGVAEHIPVLVDIAIAIVDTYIADKLAQD